MQTHLSFTVPVPPSIAQDAIRVDKGQLTVLAACELFQFNRILWQCPVYHPRIYANINGATIEASLSTMNFGVVASSLPHVIFSLGTAPE